MLRIDGAPALGEIMQSFVTVSDGFFFNHSELKDFFSSSSEQQKSGFAGSAYI
jgi:hypothetical protein